MLRLCKFPKSYKFVKIGLKLYNPTDTARYWSKKDYFLASWQEADEYLPAGYYYHSCHSSVQAVKAAQKKYGGAVFHRSQLVFCYAEEF